MQSAAKSKRLKKDLGLFSVFALATGATLSSGFFLLPGLAFQEAGPAIVLCYLIAVVPLIPAMFSMVELATAMPRAGGAYYFLDRSMGPLVGTIGGLGTWLALMLKVAFALIGMGAYLHLYLPRLPIVPAAVGLAVLFAAANLLGAKKIGSIQVILVGSLLAILFWFIGTGSLHVGRAHFSGFFDAGFESIIGTAGLVYISYVGVTKVASVAEEVKNPERNLPLGVFLSIGTAVTIYGLGTFVMVGVIPSDRLLGDLTPVATCAEIVAGPWGRGFVTVAALLAFFAVANAGILSASRYPLAMSRDHLLPALFQGTNRRGSPAPAIYATLAVIVLVLVAFDPMKIAKLASAFQLLMFGMICIAVIVMRESNLDSYDTGYRSPFYPWMQLLGIALPCWLILEMGWLPVLFCACLLVLGVGWYFYYAKGRVVRHGAIYHIFERLGRSRFDGIDQELRDFLKERGLRDEDPYDEIVARAPVLDLSEALTFEELAREASNLLARRLPVSAEALADGFLEGTRVGATPVASGAALPHVRVRGLFHPDLVIVRSVAGLHIESQSAYFEGTWDKPVYALFFLASPEEEAAQHLRILAQLAKHIDNDAFMSEWLAATDELDMKEILLREERLLSLDLHAEGRSAPLIGRALRDLHLPRGCLVALIRRGVRSIVPDGSALLREGDRLTIIGNPQSIQQLHDRYGVLPAGPK